MIKKNRERHFLNELERTIRALELKIGPHAPFVRPFICDGPVTACNIFLVGTNPQENIPFRPYWDGCAYHKRGWEKEYLWQRYKRAISDIAAGQKSRTIVSSTRKKIELFCTAALPARVLETNIYPIATRTEAELDLNPIYRDDSIFCLLFRELCPRLVVTHGSAARERVSTLLQGELDEPNASQSGLLRHGAERAIPSHVISLRHLGGRSPGSFGYRSMIELGTSAKEAASVGITE
jgi:hypothetical protein